MPRGSAILAVLLAALLAAPAGAQNVRVKTGPGAAGQGAGAAGGGIGTGLNTPDLTTGGLQAPTLLPTLKTPVSTPEIEGGTSKSVLVAPAGKSLALPHPLPGEKAPVDPVLVEALSGAGEAGVPSVEGAAETEAADRSDEGMGGLTVNAAVASGRARFDGAAPKRAGVWDAIRSFVHSPDKVPAYPGKPGDSARVAGRSYSMDRKLSETPGSVRYLTRTGGDNAVVLLRAGSPEAGAFEAEFAARVEMARAGIPHAEVLGVSADGLAYVEMAYDGPTLARELERGSWGPDKTQSLAHIAALLMLRGRTADLRPENLVWDKWRGRWAFVRASGFQPAGAGTVLGQLFGHDIFQRAGVARAAFLSALRGRLGPGSSPWRALVSAGMGDARMRQAFEELAREDAKRRPGPRLEFAAEEAPEALDDSLVTPREMKRRLGYDPRTVTPRYKLHGDDPGKLNTDVAMLFPDTPQARVYKAAEVRIIRNELFLRKVVHRYFARYFKAPWSLAYLDGYDSVMVMEKAGGAQSWGRNSLTDEQRVALAVLMRTFGVGDVNPGNILYKGDRVSLIDFEQALSRAPPAAYRLPIASILEELPWVNSEEPMEIETFFAGMRDWREHFRDPKTQDELRGMLEGSGFTKEESAAALKRFSLNVADLEWTIQTDVDFAENFAKK